MDVERRDGGLVALLARCAAVLTRGTGRGSSDPAPSVRCVRLLVHSPPSRPPLLRRAVPRAGLPLRRSYPRILRRIASVGPGSVST